MATTETRDTVEVSSAFSQRTDNIGNATLGALAINKGSIVCVNAAGAKVPGSTATGLVCIGRAEQSVPALAARNVGEDNVKTRCGSFWYDNDGDIIQASVGADCYVVDDETVSLLGTGKSVCGKILKLGTLGVLVGINPLA